VRASTALMQMINQDLSAREQQRDVVLEQARRDFESFRNEDLLGYAEVNGKSVPVVAVSVLDFADGALMTSINPRTGEFWSGTPVLAANFPAAPSGTAWAGTIVMGVGWELLTRAPGSGPLYPYIAGTGATAFVFGAALVVWGSYTEMQEIDYVLQAPLWQKFESEYEQFHER